MLYCYKSHRYIIYIYIELKAFNLVFVLYTYFYIYWAFIKLPIKIVTWVSITETLCKRSFITSSLLNIKNHQRQKMP